MDSLKERSGLYRQLRASLVVGLFSLVLSFDSFAQVSQNFLKDEQPRYELGAGFILLNIPDYPGSENNRLRVVPFPYYIYRGKYLRADDEGTRARLLSSKYHEFGLSLSFNFPVRSGNNPRREGMPDLNTLMGAGPRLLFRLMPDETKQRLNLSISARALLSSDFQSQVIGEGLVLQPSLSYWRQLGSFTAFSSLSVELASAEVHQYFYQVDPIYATASRPAYHAQAGLLETSLSTGLGYNWGEQVFLFSSIGASELGLSQNRESPLLATTTNFFMVFGVVWTFFESEEKVLRLSDQILN